MKLIINADDFGMDENRTVSILECFSRGIITQTTLMVNMPWADNAVAMAKDGGVSDRIGLHLNFTEGEPLTDEMRSNLTFCDRKGVYTGQFHKTLFRRLSMTGRDLHAIEVEARAQMERYLSYKLPLLHIDSHHHAHTDWSLARKIVPLARDLGFKSVRLSRNLGHGLTFTKNCYKLFFNNKIRNSGFVTTDYFCGFEVDTVCHMIYRNVILEMMTHPFRYKGNMPDGTGELGDSCRPIVQLEQFVADIRDDLDMISYKDI